jgi:hypothetical protein
MKKVADKVAVADKSLIKYPHPPPWGGLMQNAATVCYLLPFWEKK